jgi:CubicO group peptidase (beta-lactamase class C family)
VAQAVTLVQTFRVERREIAMPRLRFVDALRDRAWLDAVAGVVRTFTGPARRGLRDAPAGGWEERLVAAWARRHPERLRPPPAERPHRAAVAAAVLGEALAEAHPGSAERALLERALDALLAERHRIRGLDPEAARLLAGSRRELRRAA